MNGYTAAFGGLVLVVAVVLWCYEKLPRTVTWLLAVAAACGATTITAWRAGLLHLTSQGSGLAALGPVFALALLGFFFEGIRGHMMHPLRTPAFGIAFGVACVLAGGNLHRLTQSGGSAAQATAMNIMGRTSQAGAQTHVSNVAALIGAGSVAAVLVIIAVNVKGGGTIRGSRKKRPAATGTGLTPATRRTSPSSRSSAGRRTPPLPGSSSSRNFPPRPGSSGRTP